MLQPLLLMATLEDHCTPKWEVCCYFLSDLLTLQLASREGLDQTDGVWSIFLPHPHLWNCLPHQLCCHLLSCLSSHPHPHYGSTAPASGPHNCYFLQLAVAGICLFVILPLNLVGTILGRNISGQPDNPCRVNTVPRPIPEKKW